MFKFFLIVDDSFFLFGTLSTMLWILLLFPWQRNILTCCKSRILTEVSYFITTVHMLSKGHSSFKLPNVFCQLWGLVWPWASLSWLVFSKLEFWIKRVTNIHHSCCNKFLCCRKLHQWMQTLQVQELMSLSTDSLKRQWAPLQKVTIQLQRLMMKVVQVMLGMKIQVEYGKIFLIFFREFKSVCQKGMMKILVFDSNYHLFMAHMLKIKDICLPDYLCSSM